MSTLVSESLADKGPVLEPLTMQIVVRRDLLDAEGWGVGPLLAQTAHAATAVLHEFRDREATQAYLADLKHMRKVVLQAGQSHCDSIVSNITDVSTLKTADESSLSKLATLLSAAEPPIAYHLWVEQPENVPTCLALAPNRKERPVRKALDKTGCRLWKA